MFVRKKSVIVEAVKFEYTKEGLERLRAFAGVCVGQVRKARHPSAKAELEIRTLEDGNVFTVKHIATEGDWIIKGVQNEFYACKPDIFDLTYDILGDTKPMETQDKNLGWTCPKCGAPNSPANKVCVACFLPQPTLSMPKEGAGDSVGGPQFLTEAE